MNRDLIFALIRHFLTFLGTFLATKGVIDAGVVEQLVGGGLALAAVVWSVLDKKALAKAKEA